ncbi:MAG: T9SS type A sorting domain-containing protein [Salinibacter sp.]|uniref:T9SS type A sorting domain-containing protein n=1 Tax=Salinibacter sp. TaxID=2065818 RepID=UPI0035D3FFA7
MHFVGGKGEYTVWTVVGSLSAVLLVSSVWAQQFRSQQVTTTKAGGAKPVHAASLDKDSGTASSGKVNSTPVESSAHLAFSSDRDGNQEIYVRRPDGSFNRLTDDSRRDRNPDWSPDGETIAFQRRTSQSDHDIYTVEVASGQVQPVVNNSAKDRKPSWSPDGNQFAFTSKSGSYEDNDLLTMDADGSSRAEIVTGASEVDQGTPSWSVDDRIAYPNDITNGDGDVHAIDPDGQNDTNLTDDSSTRFAGPHWSPDGNKVAMYSGGYSGNDWEIYVLDVQTGNLTQLTDNSANDRHPTWSPGGGRIAFASDRDGDFEIYTISANGGGDLIQITDNSARDFQPDWNPSSSGSDDAPPEPSGLQETIGDEQVELDWNPVSADDLAGYNVYRAPFIFSEVNKAVKLNKSLIGSTSYTDSGLLRGTKYFYRVTAVDDDGNESNPSSEVTAVLQDLKLIGLEVNQSIQDWNNSVPLIQGKKTIVRAHLQNRGSSPAPVKGIRLKGTRNGSSLAKSPLEPEAPFEAPPETNPEIAKHRADLEKSLYFVLPPSWLHGTVNLQLVGKGLQCSTAPAVDSNCELQVEFKPTAVPEITFVELYWRDQSGNLHYPTGNTDAEIQRLIEMYPIKNIIRGIKREEMAVVDTPTDTEVHEKLRDMREADLEGGSTSEDRIYMGLVEEFEKDGTSGATPLPLPSNVAAAAPDTTGPTDEPLHHSVAHEIAHALGIGHAVDQNGNTYCGSKSKSEDPHVIPYNKPEIIEKTPLNFEGFAALGPTKEKIYDEMWGINVRKKRVKGTSTALSTGKRPNGPNAELMSYCTLLGADYVDFVGRTWVSDITYTTLRESINARFSPDAPNQLASLERQASPKSGKALSLKNGQENEYLMVKGEINTADKSASFRPFTAITVSSDQVGALMPEPGDYTLQMLDQGGSVVEEVSFEPRVALSRNVSEIGFFSIPVPADSAIETAQVVFEGNEKSPQKKQSNGEVIGSTTASQNPPTITVESPNGGEDLGDDSVTLEWSASDPDEDTLSYTVHYSPNGGSTWKALATSWPRDSLTVNATALGGTGNGLIRVQASDGFNTAQDKSDGTFGTSNVPPSANIFSPTDGAVTDTSGFITLEGSANDTEDGSLSGSALRWETASGDSLGIGETIDVSAANFSLGAHTIELVATDSLGASDTASVSIQVALSNDPSLLASVSSLVESDSLHDFGPTGTNIDFAGTIGAATVTVELYDSAPIGASGIPQSNVSKYRVLIGAGNGLTVGQGTEVRFEADTLGGINDPTKVQIYRRPAPSNGPFAALDTQVDSMGTPGDPSDDEIYAAVDGFGEFVLASNSQPLPVELSDFEATVDGERVRLTWTTASETNNVSFRVQRRVGDEGSTWTTVGSVEGAGTTTEARSYRFVDEELPYEADRLTYRLKQVDTDGSASYSKEVTVERSVKEVELLGTYPNPAQQRATVRYAVPERQDVKIYLYDILGRRVQTVVDGEREGRHKRQLDVSRLASGVYFLRLQAEGQTRTQKLTVVR